MPHLLFVVLFVLLPLTTANESALRSLMRNKEKDRSSTAPSGQRRTTSVSLNFFGSPDLLTDNDFDELSRAFKQAYNDAGSSPYLNIEEVSVDFSTDENDSTRRKLHNRMAERRLQNEPIIFDYTFVFLVTFQCNGCTDDFIYDNDGSRRRQLELDGTRGLNQEVQKPKRSAFTKKFNQILSRLNMTGARSLNRVSEVEVEEQCEARDLGLKEMIEIEFRGDFNALMDNEREIANLERAVKKSYNTLNAVNPTVCDVLFRKVVKARYQTIRSLRRENTFAMTFEIEYQCRGCAMLSEGTRSLFDHPVDNLDEGRATLDVDFRELGPKEAECSCGREIEMIRSPLQSEYYRALQSLLDIRSSEGKISSISGVLSM
mmetsp:Transcript_29981/g.45459  ORF Transcript_29981/g.45459 Transcript_29981/m.45459 type:complete len:374 (+) Transcript_29981:87-1208(+)